MRTNELFVKPAADKGQQMEIELPDGKKSGQFLTVLGADSDAFRAALAEHRRAQSELFAESDKMPPVKLATKEQELRCNLISSLVAGWTFEDEFNGDAVRVLFRNAPYVMSQVDEFAGQRKNFFTPPSVG